VGVLEQSRIEDARALSSSTGTFALNSLTAKRIAAADPGDTLLRHTDNLNRFSAPEQACAHSTSTHLTGGKAVMHES
jgi:hypothetical protein